MIRVVLLFLMLFPKTATFCRDIYGYINDVNGTLSRMLLLELCKRMELF